MKRTVLIILSITLHIGTSLGQSHTNNTTAFHTIGYVYQHRQSESAPQEPDSMDEEDYTDEENVCEPPADSMKVYMPMVSLPLRSIKVTSPFGIRRDPMNRNKHSYHSGLDLRARYENVYSMLPGTITFAGYSKIGGNYVTVSHGVCSCSYLHLSKIRVKVGEHVSAGQNIGVSGNTGSRTTGPHLHISVRLNDAKRKYFNPMLILGFVSEQLLNQQSSK